MLAYLDMAKRFFKKDFSSKFMFTIVKIVIKQDEKLCLASQFCQSGT